MSWTFRRSSCSFFIFHIIKDAPPRTDSPFLWGGLRATKLQTLSPFILSSPSPTRSHIRPRAPHPRQWREEWWQALLLLPREGLRGGPESHDPVQDWPDLPGEFITAVGETCRWSSPLKGLYGPHNGQLGPCVFLSAAPEMRKFPTDSQQLQSTKLERAPAKRQKTKIRAVRLGG